MFAHMDNDNETVTAEMKAIAEDYKESEHEAIEI